MIITFRGKKFKGNVDCQWHLILEFVEDSYLWRIIIASLQVNKFEKMREREREIRISHLGLQMHTWNVIFLWSPLSPKHMQDIFINWFRICIYSHGTYPNPFLNFGWRCMDLLRPRRVTTVIGFSQAMGSGRD